MVHPPGGLDNHRPSSDQPPAGNPPAFAWGNRFSPIRAHYRLSVRFFRHPLPTAASETQLADVPRVDRKVEDLRNKMERDREEIYKKFDVMNRPVYLRRAGYS
jgi:hypothetical protein